MATRKNSIYRFLIFVGTFALIIGGFVVLFGAFEFLGNGLGTAVVASVGTAANASDSAIAAAALNPILPLPAISSGTAATTSTAFVRHPEAAKPQAKVKPVVALAPPPPSPPPDLAVISDSLNGFALSLADTIRSLPTPSQATSSASAVPPAAATTTPAAVAVSTTTVTAPTTTVPVSSQALPYTLNGFSDMAGWRQSWGSAVVASGSLAIGATTSTTGGEALLTDSDAWTNYVATVSLDWVKGQTFSLLARYHEGKNNVSCQFVDDGAVSVYSTINGRRTLLGMGTAQAFNPTQPVTASIRVDGDRVQCGLNNSVVNDYRYYGLPQILLSGGIDIETWDPQVGNAQILLHKVSVIPLGS